jgi:hypothetical protein
MVFSIQHAGVPDRAEKIPFEPDLGNTSGGKRASEHILWGIFLSQRVCPMYFLRKFDREF